MGLIKNQRPSPWMLIAVAALAFAMVGTAIAGTDAVSKLTKAKVKSIAKKQADKELKANVAGSHVNLADRATTADSATSATTATTVNGQKVTKIFAKIAPNGSATLGTFDTLTIIAECDATGDVETLDVDPSTTDWDLDASGDGNAGPIFDHNQGLEPNFISLDDDGINDNDRGTATFAAARSNGVVVTGNIAFNDSNAFGDEPVCAIYGEVVSSG